MQIAWESHMPCFLIDGHILGVALSPGPLRVGERAWYTLCAHQLVRMRYFPSKHQKFVFLSVYFSIDMTLDLD